MITSIFFIAAKLLYTLFGCSLLGGLLTFLDYTIINIMITLKSCPVCDSNLITQYHQTGFAPHVIHEIMPGVRVDAAIITRYSVCQNCNMIFQNPRLSDRQLDDFYGKGYYRKTLNLTDEEKDKDEEYRAKTDAKIIKQYVGKVKTHLDIGCSRGYLLDAIGATVKVGVETDVDNVKVKDIEVYSTMDHVPHKKFDLITAIHVLEHVPSPLEYLQSMAKFVSKDGYLVVEVPTWKSPGGPLRLSHLFHFESDVLRLMCREVGLKVTDVKFTPHLMLICKLDQI